MKMTITTLVPLVFAMWSYSACASDNSERKRLRQRAQHDKEKLLYRIGSKSKENNRRIDVDNTITAMFDREAGLEFERLLNGESMPISMSMLSPTSAPNQQASTSPPKQKFDFALCDSFSAKWLFELASSCDSPTSLDNCECPTAKALLGNGTITCVDESEFGELPIGACPEKCTVCEFCMVINGCPDIYGVADEQMPF